MLNSDLAARHVGGSASAELAIPDVIYPIIPEWLYRYSPLSLNGVNLRLSEAVTDLAFLAAYPEIAIVEFHGGVVQTSAVRSLRKLPALRVLGFQSAPSIQHEEILTECAGWPRLEQLGFYGAPFPAEDLDEFRRLRPDVTIYLGWARPLHGPPDRPTPESKGTKRRLPPTPSGCGRKKGCDDASKN